jgi:hypothetical protein
MSGGKERFGRRQCGSPRRAIARVMVRRDASRRAILELVAFLESSAVGGYTLGEIGSARSGYWTTINVTDRHDLDRIREHYRRLIDGWQELP